MESNIGVNRRDPVNPAVIPLGLGMRFSLKQLLASFVVCFFVLTAGTRGAELLGFRAAIVFGALALVAGLLGFFLFFQWRKTSAKKRIVLLFCTVALVAPVIIPTPVWAAVWPAMSSHIRAREIKTFATSMQNSFSSTPSLRNVSIFYELERVDAWYDRWLYGDKVRLVGDVPNLDDYNYLRGIIDRDCPTTADFDVTINGKLPPPGHGE